MPRRVVVEASPTQKENLDLFLSDTGTTLTDWFSDRVAEATARYEVARLSTVPQPGSLDDLRNSADVYAALSKIDWSFTDADTGSLSHNLHPYPAKFIPQIPRHLIGALTLPGELVWDPFGGSGTTALEALIAGRRAISSDINPVAQIVGLGKTMSLTGEDDLALTTLVERIELLSRSPEAIDDIARQQADCLSANVPPIPNVEKWFHPHAVRELAYIRWQLERSNHEPWHALAKAAFSKIVLRASFQDNETRYASKPKEVKVGSVLRLFAGELDSARSRARATSTALRFRSARFQIADARYDDVVASGSVDLVVTSPPYPNATDYHLYHRFRLYWLGFSPQEVGRHEIGSHLRHQKEESGMSEYVGEMSMALRRIHCGLRPGRYAVLVLGDGVFEGSTHDTASLMAQAATAVGFEVVGSIDRAVHSTRRSFISAARRLRTEQLLVLRRPLRIHTFRLEPPPYRLWPYEQSLRVLEISRLLGNEPKANEAALTVDADSLVADRLRRLTFTHAFGADAFAGERTWQAILENGDARDRRRKDPKYATHGLHSYKGKFYPQLAKSLFNIGTLKPGQLVLDPFCGSGTVLLEAKLNGLQSKGLDLNPLAVQVARAKVGALTIDPGVADRLLSSLLASLERALMDSPDPRDVFSDNLWNELRSWFAQPILRKLTALASRIDEVPELALKELLKASLSNIIRDVSHQDPKDLRIRRRKQPLADAPVIELFAKQVVEQRRRIIELAERAAFSPCKFGHADVYLGDCRLASTFENARIESRSVDAVITSPPYATALPYIDTDRLSLLLLFGLNSRERARIEYDLTGSREITTGDRVMLEELVRRNDFGDIASVSARRAIRKVFKLNAASQVGFRRKNQGALLYRYYRDISFVMQHLDRVIKPGGSLFFVIGDNTTIAGGQRVLIPSAQAIREMGAELGWSLRGRIPITVTKEARPHHRNSITENDILWFERH